jgi:hypothetical protein
MQATTPDSASTRALTEVSRGRDRQARLGPSAQDGREAVVESAGAGEKARSVGWGWSSLMVISP